MLSLHPLCLSFPSQYGSGGSCVRDWNPWVKMEPLGVWLQLPRQVMEDEQKPADRVRLPRSLFATLQGSRATVRLAISVLDIGPGDLFKVRRSWMEAQGSSGVRRSVYRAVPAFCGLP